MITCHIQHVTFNMSHSIKVLKFQWFMADKVLECPIGLAGALVDMADCVLDRYIAI